MIALVHGLNVSPLSGVDPATRRVTSWKSAKRSIPTVSSLAFMRYFSMVASASTPGPNSKPDLTNQSRQHPTAPSNSVRPTLPPFVDWPAFPFEGGLRIKPLQEPVDAEPPRRGDRQEQCAACHTPDSAYLWSNERWRLKSPPAPSGLPVVVILEPRAHLDLGDLSTMHAAELGVLTVRLERAIRSLESVAQVHVNRWGDGTAHLQQWFLARPQGYLQLRGPFMTMWDEILPPVEEHEWQMNLEYIAAWLSDD